MNILFALPGFHRFDRGAEVALLSVAAELGRLGHAVTVVGSGEAQAGTPYKFVRIPSIRREHFERFPRFPPFRSETAWEDATFAGGLLARVPLRNYDATVTCSFPFSHWALRRRGRAGPAHIFVTQNGDWPAASNDSEFKHFNCDMLVCTNPDYLARNRESWPCALIPNGVDLGRFRPGDGQRQRFGIPEDGLVILMVSAFISSKRIFDGIQAVARLEGAHLVIAGDGPLREDAKAKADETLPGRFTQLTVSAAEMPALYRSADVFMHLSLNESFGNVFLEAWASGLPIVAHESKRLRWILGEGHFLCDTRDPTQLDQALSSATAAKKAAPSPAIKRFSWPSIGKQYEAAILSAVSINQLDNRRKY
jgi:glycosyltransferase involved in cell wall biosynthesis